MSFTWTSVIGMHPKKDAIVEVGNNSSWYSSQLSSDLSKIVYSSPRPQGFTSGTYGGWCDKLCNSRGQEVVSTSNVNTLLGISSCSNKKVTKDDIDKARALIDGVDNDEYNASTNPKGIWKSSYTDPISGRSGRRAKCIAKNFDDAYTTCSEFGKGSLGCSSDVASVTETEYRASSKHLCTTYYTSNLWTKDTTLNGTHRSYVDLSDYSSNNGSAGDSGRTADNWGYS